MQEVCSNCHAAGWVENFYKQYDNTVDLYNEKFAKPAKAIMEKLYADGKLTKTPFDDKLEWTYYELWHHQGRRARMGTAMMGPDYTQWHGFYEWPRVFTTSSCLRLRPRNPASPLQPRRAIFTSGERDSLPKSCRRS